MPSEYIDFSTACHEDETAPQDQPSTHFPAQLHYILQELQKEGKDDIASWLGHGRAFRVHPGQTGRFVTDVLQTWFRQNKYPSFQRQLSLYGFKRVTSGRDKGAYYHELFLRSKRFLCRRIKRKLNKATSSGPNASRGEDEPAPDFYSMPILPEEATATAASGAATALIEGDTERRPKGRRSLKRPPASLGENVDVRASGARSCPTVLASSSLRTDASTRAFSSRTHPLTPSQNLASLTHQQHSIPATVAFAAMSAAGTGGLADLLADMSSPNPRWLLERQALLSQHAATAAAALMTSQAQTLALQRLSSGLSAFHSGTATVPQAPNSDPSFSRLSRSLLDHHHSFSPQLSRTIPLPALQGLVQQQQLLRQLQSQPPPQPPRRSPEESKSTDLTALMEAYMRRFNESNDSY